MSSALERRRNISVVMENVDIGFLNFGGVQKRFNDEGKRNFCIFLEPEVAEAMLHDGWNVKHLKPREEGDIPQAYLQVAVSYNPNAKPPKVDMVTSKNRTRLPENMIYILDMVDIRTTDVILNGSRWDVNGNTGIKAYLKHIVIVIDEDPLDLKYAHLDSPPRAIESGYDDDEIVIDPVDIEELNQRELSDGAF